MTEPLYEIDVYNAELDERTCSECADLDGSVFLHGKGPEIPRHDHCRCHYTTLWVTYSEWEGRRAAYKQNRREQAMKL